MLRIQALVLFPIVFIFACGKPQSKGTSYCAAGGEELTVAMDAWSATYAGKARPPQYEGRGNRTATIALKEGVCEMGASSEVLPDEDVHAIVSAGKKAVAIPVAIEAIAFIVSNDIPATSISQQQVVQIFARGEQDGTTLGMTGKIQAYGINSATDRYHWIRKDILGAAFSDQVREMSGPLALADRISQTSGGIGYARPREAGSARILSVGTQKGIVPPSPENIRNGAYPFTRRYFLYLVNPSQETRAFVRFVLSDEAQKQLLPIGLYPLDEQSRRESLRLLDQIP